MSTTKHTASILTFLSSVALACALTACGGGGGDNSGPNESTSNTGGNGSNPGSNGSSSSTGSNGSGSSSNNASGSGTVSGCFTVPNTLNFRWATVGSASFIYPVQTTIGPKIIDGIAATLTQTIDSAGLTEYDWWTITSSGISQYNWMPVDSNGNVDLSNTAGGDQNITPWLVLPQNMQPGQSANINMAPLTGYWTFIGFETVTLAGKTFTNACHFKQTYSAYGTTTSLDSWYAYGYGLIKTNDLVIIYQYNGDL